MLDQFVHKNLEVLIMDIELNRYAVDSTSFYSSFNQECILSFLLILK